MNNQLPVVKSDQIRKFYGGLSTPTIILQSLNNWFGQCNALDILYLRDVSDHDKIWLTLREDFLPKQVLGEFACWCAEQALKKSIKNDPRSVAAIQAKRDWLAGRITDNQLDDAEAAADSAATDIAIASPTWNEYTFRDSNVIAALEAAEYAAHEVALYAAQSAKRAAGRDAPAAHDAAVEAARAAGASVSLIETPMVAAVWHRTELMAAIDSARKIEERCQIEHLINMLNDYCAQTTITPPPNEELTIERVAKEYREICGDDCCGDPSTGIQACPFYQPPDVKGDEVIPEYCKLDEYCRPNKNE